MKKIIITIFSILIFSNAFSQSNTLYFNTKVFQSNDLNPARQLDCNVTIGLPVLSSAYINYTNKIFSFNDFFFENPLLPDTARFVPNIDTFYNNLKPLNFLFIQNRESLGNLAFRVHGFQISISGGINIEQSLAVPKSMFSIIDGNYFEDGRYFSVTDLGMQTLAYTDFSIGISKEVIPGLVVGGKIKFLRGLANLSLSNFKLDWHVSTEDTANYEWALNTSYIIQESNNAIKIVPTFDSTGMINGIETQQNQLLENGDNVGFAKENLLHQNFGIGFDFGVIYTWNNMVELSASVLDLGFIKWTSNPLTVQAAEKELTFSGLDPGAYLGNTNIFTLIKDKDLKDSLNSQMISDLTDTAIQLLNPSISDESYKTKLNTKLHFGAAYTQFDWLSAGFLYNGYLYNGKLYSSYTLASTLKFWRGWSYSLSYTMFSHNYNNLGMGISYKLGPFLTYLQMDNISPIAFATRYALFPDKPYNEGVATKWLKSTQYLTLHFGINFVFGCKNKKDYGLID